MATEWRGLAAPSWFIFLVDEMYQDGFKQGNSIRAFDSARLRLSATSPQSPIRQFIKLIRLLIKLIRQFITQKL
jgi:hypothetical protein